MGVAAAVSQAGQGGASMRIGTVTSYAAGAITVDVGGGALVAASYLSSYLPVAGDIVALLGSGSTWVVLGNFGTVPGQLAVRDDTGATVVEIGRLGDGSFGLAAVNGAGQISRLSDFVFGPASQVIDLDEGCTSSDWGDLATFGPSVTVDIGQTGRALIFSTISVFWQDVTPDAFDGAYATLVASGANTIAPDNINRVGSTVQVGGTTFTEYSVTASRFVFLTGLNEGPTTFWLQYKTAPGKSCSFDHRGLGVFPY